MENLQECPKCNSSKLEPFLNCIDHAVTKEEFKLDRCKNCDFIFTNPRPDITHINKYYESDEYISHSNSKAGITNKIYHFIKNIAIENKIKLIEKLEYKNKTLLDIGCGTGSFLDVIKKHGWSVAGIEPNKKAREAALKNYGITVLEEENLKALPKESFSIITMWHVLEHVHPLKQRMIDLYRLLEVGGWAIIAVPNYTSWDANHYGNVWAAYDVPRHLYHFSPKTIKELFQQNNLEKIDSIAMKFDSFYVSLLSEKYKKSILQLFKAFIIGLYSNLVAGNAAEKYSSVIYIFQKQSITSSR